ncbi:MAG: DUF86 domain-containing protein, partial [Oscillospiraceae bacterium]|nr:DUF86 domain-containing protein [Oscillospiraceae bacterium]
CCFMEHRDRLLLEKIISYCERIADNLLRYEYSFEIFAQDHMFQDACCMCVVQIGELVSQLSEEVKQKNRSIPWRAIKDTRNFYVHAYGAIDLQAVWATLNEDIPVLKDACEKILA